jgi:hypothetical protein
MTRRDRPYAPTVPEQAQLLIAERRANGEDLAFDMVVAERLCDLGYLEACVARGTEGGEPNSTAYMLTPEGRALIAGRLG